MMAFFSTITGQFSYFAEQLSESNWCGKRVLDFGGNIGNMLRDPKSTIDPELYWCLDVTKASIERGKAIYPKSHWIFYDRYCFFFNANGVPNCPIPDLGVTFDYVVAYSVFTNTNEADMLQLVKQLQTLVARNGALAFTFIDPHHVSWPGEYYGDNFDWRLDREIELERERGRTLELPRTELKEKIRDAKWFMLVNGTDLYLENDPIRSYAPEQQQTCHAFHAENYMRTLFPHADILPPVNREMQHCCVIRKS